MGIELTDDDLRALAETVRAELTRSLQQIVLLRRAFPKIADVDIQAMAARIEPNPAGKVDVALHYLALHMRLYEEAQAELDMLVVNGSAATLQRVLSLLLTCANIVNALTLLTRGGFATQLHIDEMQGVARSDVARSAADKRHEKTNDAKLWVQQQWKLHGASYSSKAEFARKYVESVRHEYDVTVTKKTITDDWLAPAALASS